MKCFEVKSKQGLGIVWNDVFQERDHGEQGACDEKLLCDEGKDLVVAMDSFVWHMAW